MKPDTYDKTVIAITVVFILSWGTNFYKFLASDFESPYRSEVIHAVGVFVPPLSFITVWFE